MTGFTVASFLAFGALLVLYGSTGSELRAALDLSYADLGLLGACLSLGLGVGIVLAGPLVDRLPRRPLYVAACGCVLVACAVLGPWTGFRGLMFSTILIGFGAGFYETILNALVVETHGAQAPRRLVFIHCGATLAASLAPLFFEVLRESIELAWYDTFRIAGAAHLLLIGAASFVPMPAAPSREATAGIDTARSTREPSPVLTSTAAAGTAEASPVGVAGEPVEDRLAFAALCLATFAYVGVESALTLFVADHARTDLGLDASRAAGTISAFWTGLLVGRLGVGLAPRAPGAGTTAALAALAAAIVFGFGSGWISPPELAMAGTGFFLGGVFPVMIGLAGQALPKTAGLAVGLAGGLGSLGGFVVPWITGALAASGGLSSALAALSGWLGLLVAGAAFVRLRRR
ncbi:MAG: MFS transporter [Deltaproteobacteria bacterium]|nr:MFS transporter [Deltaproteobacteria bacterium]